MNGGGGGEWAKRVGGFSLISYANQLGLMSSLKQTTEKLSKIPSAACV